jgi:hypothetical protein
MNKAETKLVHMCGYINKPTEVEQAVFLKEIREDDFLSVKEKMGDDDGIIYLASREDSNDIIEEYLEIIKNQKGYRQIPTERMKWN